MGADSTRAPVGATTLITNIDEALADHEVATALHEAAVRFVDDLRCNALNWPSEHSAFIVHNAKQADIMLAEMDRRMDRMKARLDTALVQALATERAVKVGADEEIIAAFDRRATAFTILQELPDDPQGQGETPERLAQWAIVDAAEAEIGKAVAMTPRGAELQLWAAAAHMFDTAEDEAPCYRADLEYLEAQGDSRDWKDRLVIAALRSLREQGK
jgi:hypothetical protein